jgi:hypothetical protein
VKGIHHHIETEMQKEIKFEKIKDRDDETIVGGIKFETRALVAYLVKAFGLNDETKRRNVEISITVNGAKLESSIHHVTIGFKIFGKMFRDPISGMFLFSNEAGMCDEQHLDNMQSGR